LQYIFLSHDVDWGRQGAPLEHIIARKDRFEKGVFENAAKENLYYNIPDYMDLEERFNVRSTFFFRTVYENGDYKDYENEIRALIRGGWEVGLHLDPSSINDTVKIYQEKRRLEDLSREVIRANRCHYLAFNEQLPHKLQQLGFVYDSSLRKSKDRIDREEMGYRIFDNLIEFPVTIMDAYIFTYMKIAEEKILSIFEKTLDYSRALAENFGVLTVIWHDNVLKMKGGRMYSKILEYLTSQQDVRLVRGIDLATMIRNRLAIV
jgi:peptidoglycan/xylan/chitin deacetylase (PgdA/CDA1 family)